MGVCNVPVISTVCHVAGKAAATVVSAPFDWIAQGVGNAAEWMFKGVWQLFDSTTLVDVTDPNYLKVYDVLFGIAVFLMLLFFLLQLLTGLIRRDPGALHRAGIGLAKSVLGSFLVITVTGLALTIVDELCVGIIQATGTTLDEMGGKIAALAAGIGAISLSAPGAGAVIIIFLGCLAITGAAIVWFSLLIRKALLLVAVVLAPIALSGQSWDHARGWFSKWASFVVALIVSKLVVVVIFLVAINQMNAPLNLDLSSISNPVAGIVLMFVAAFAPYMAYKFISFVGFDLHHAMSAESEAKGAMNRPIPVPVLPGLSNARKVLGGGSNDSGGSGSGSGGGGGGGSGSPPPGGGSPVGGGSGDAAAGGASEAGAGEAAGAAGGPVGLAAVAGAQAVTAAAKAGPETGRAVGRAAEEHADAGQAAAGQSASGDGPSGSSRSGSIPVPPAPATPASAGSTPTPTSSPSSQSGQPAPAAPTGGTAPPPVPAPSGPDATSPREQRPSPPPAAPPRPGPSPSEGDL
ncbi:conjugal transfer protein TrbL [Calidifontibacter sp. DB0510]|uniref:Conjugal transfer protein TrbL n=1 Tax=Metallococcus carri TaxID=1656884 RepID=A0A967B0M4_9MICO|nr:conjugal transfer protein TrbL [Metallococcus carri]NHN55854.1 conjugal transfer protein TrbL [Metallococcus carri]NOP38458.1 conjugal transfer protein TrbL [Calidifontibacter sp. DB2511S]